MWDIIPTFPTVAMFSIVNVKHFMPDFFFFGGGGYVYDPCTKFHVSASDGSLVFTIKWNLNIDLSHPVCCSAFYKNIILAVAYFPKLCWHTAFLDLTLSGTDVSSTSDHIKH
jgi:hypothetical protein